MAEPGERILGRRRRLAMARWQMDSNLDDLGKTFRIPDPSGSQFGCADGGGITLVFLEGPRAGEVIEIDRLRTVIGRREDVDLTLPSRAVSKEHCVLTLADGAVEIEDLGSTNGVAVNGTRLQPGGKRRLFHGDSIRLAENLALFRQTGCFGDATGASRIQIDRAQVASEVEQLMGEFAKWTASTG
jgi:pSer/pThr/pTyr-binding forkhead associated (FHA) protein